MINSLIDVLEAGRRVSRREAVRFVTRSGSWGWSYETLRRHVESTAAWLTDDGVRRGDRVALWSENRPEWLAAFWAVQLVGAVAVPIDYASSPRLAQRFVQAADCSLLLYGTGTTNLPDVKSFPLLDIPFTEHAAVNWNPPEPDDIAQILFTSGTTGQPKGVVHRHRLLADNLQPFAAEFARYRMLAAPFQPIRILCLLPLSHVFGQTMGLFLPPLLGGSVVLAPDALPSDVARILRENRVTVLATVPWFLDHFTACVKQLPGYGPKSLRYSGWVGAAERWWKYRSVHRRLGWKFWAVVTGGAAVPQHLGNFWSDLGILLIQGYSLTEAGPVVAVNHPFRNRPGSLGTPVGKRAIRISEDGEVWVHLPSPVEVLADGQPQPVSDDGWIGTGDLVQQDADGRLYFRGRKKEVIVTGEGFNVYPDDVEPVLREQPGIRDACIVPWTEDGSEVPAVVLVLDDSSRASDVVARANRKLEHYQRIRRWFVWPEPELPRTSATGKLKRAEIRRRLEAGDLQGGPGSAAGEAVKLTRRPGWLHLAHGSPEELLKLTSLEQVELLEELEQILGKHLPEAEFTNLRTVGDLQTWIQRNAQPPDISDEDAGRPIAFPRWTLSFFPRLIRAVVREGIALPLLRALLPLRIEGSDRFRAGPSGPLLFAANHQSLLDVLILWAALPASWRSRLAPAVRMERFAGRFAPEGRPFFTRVRHRIEYISACLLFCVFPLPQRSAGLRSALHYATELAARGYHLVIFPEGERSSDGRLLPFKPGIISLARQLQIPVQTVYLDGVWRVLPREARWPRRFPVTVRFGPRLRIHPTEKVEPALERLAEIFHNLSSGRQTDS
ncbi:MAG TPA: AMP-binding protein [Acidobacteriota bacterium]|nr:AMP-binding protein [Acidobacteriota bacterium]